MTHLDALLIPERYSSDKLRVDEAVDKFAGDFVHSGKPFFSICYPPQLLTTANAIRSRRITGYQFVRQDIINTSVQFLDQAVVEDDNLVVLFVKTVTCG